jgi:ABC-type uncharacterized transport system ATPase subunit
VFEALTVAENLELALKGDKSVWASLRARLNGEQEDRISDILRLLRLDGERAPGGAAFSRAKTVSRDRHAAGSGAASVAAG